VAKSRGTPSNKGDVGGNSHVGGSSNAVPLACSTPPHAVNGQASSSATATITATSPTKIRLSKSDFSRIGPSRCFQTAWLRLKGDFIDAVMRGVSVEVSET
jgi:hypothetical protein